MLPKWHIIVSAFVFLFLYFFLKFSVTIALFVALATVLIDLDHYFYHVFKKKEFNLKKVYEFHKRINKMFLAGKIKKEDKPEMLLVFHSLEFFILLMIAAAIFNNIFLYLIFISFLFHFLCDFIYGLITGMFVFKTYSIIAYFYQDGRTNKRERHNN